MVTKRQSSAHKISLHTPLASKVERQKEGELQQIAHTHTHVIFEEKGKKFKTTKNIDVSQEKERNSKL